MLKILSWNVNSLRIRLPILSQIVKDENPDIFCLQEVKAKNSDFPYKDVYELGFKHIEVYGMAGYNGVAILSKIPLTDIRCFDWAGKKDARHISAKVQNIEIHNIYVPAGGDIPDPKVNPSFARKLDFVEEINHYFSSRIKEIKQNNLLICGDFNIAPFENDVWNHKQLLKIVSHTPEETKRLLKWQKESELIDAVRYFFPEPEKIFTWWSYRNPNWQINNKGRRLDHIWVSPQLLSQIEQTVILKKYRFSERPSDHIPIGILLK